jgi:MEMO1 family protein
MTDPQTRRDVRPSPIAGRWYPGDPVRLAASIDGYLAQASVTPPGGRLIGVLAPHAGHHYSGGVAAHAFKLVRGLEIDLVVLVGPSHHPYPAAVLTTGHDAYQTPLGQVPVAHDILDTLREAVPIEAVRADPEHSLEIELPFLQRALDSFRLVPLALIDQSLALAEELGHALANAMTGHKALLVASSDLSHFYPQAVANELDQAVLDAIAAYDPAQVIALEDQQKGFACGRGAIATVMIAARDLGGDRAEVLQYATSGDVPPHDYQRVVGYGAAAFFQAATTG